MRPSHTGMHVEKLGILWAQAHGAGDALDGDLRLAQPALRPSAEGPGPGPIRIEHEGPLDHGVAVVEVAHDIYKRDPGSGEGDGAILAEHRCAPCQPFGLGDVPRPVDHPT